MPLPIEKLKEEQRLIRAQVREKTLGYLLAGLGLVAGLAWNDAIKALIDYFLPASRDGIIAKFLYAFLVTVVIVLATVYLTRLLARKTKEDIATEK
jgi:hypothetical protein